MNSFDKYIKRVGLSGRSSTEASLNNSIKVFELKFNTSPSFYQVDIDGSLTDVIINKTKNTKIKQIHFRYGYKPDIGSIVTHQNKRYLLLETDKDEIFTFGFMEECNNTFKVQTGEEERVQVGYDHLSRPYYEYKKVEKDEPCIVRDRYYSTNENAQLPLPDGKLDIYIKYQESPSFNINKEFSMYEKTYKIADISYVDVVEGVGIMRIHAERRDNRDE